MTIDLNRPDDHKTRTELTLARIREAWSTRTDGARYFEAVLDFLRAVRNSNSARGYAYSVLEFFEWAKRERGYSPTPDAVTRADVAAYATYLSTRDRGLEREWLEADGSRRLDLAIYDVVRDNPGIRANELKNRVAARHPELTTEAVLGGVTQRVLAIDAACLRGEGGGLVEHLGCLVHARTLRREPSMAELRRGALAGELGVTPAQSRELGIKVEVEPEVFRYYVVERDTREAERAGTVATRLVELSALWDRMILSGENRPGAEGLLRYNVWRDAIPRAAERARAQAAASRAAKAPTAEIFLRLLATTFRRTHRENALAAAAAFFRGQPVVGADAGRFGDLRDRLVLMLFGQLGLRRSEVGALRRGDVAAGVVTVTGKGGKLRQVGLPAMVGLAAAHLTAAIQRMERRGSSRARELLAPEAPLVPVVVNWGANAGLEGGSLSPAGVAMMLRRRAEDAGIDRASPDWARVHAHGFRHLFAQEWRAHGGDVAALQAQMGHASIVTTSLYAEERRPEKRIAPQFAPAPPPEPVRPAPALLPAAALAPTRAPADLGRVAEAEEPRIELTKRGHYRLRPSGHVEWLGPSKRLRPGMPVMSPAQAGECGASSVCGALADLWRRWAAELGPTATMALTEWTRVALEQAQVAGEAVVRRGLPRGERETRDPAVLAGSRSYWVPADAPADATLDLDAYREWATEDIVGWFRQHAFDYRTEPGRSKGGTAAERARAEREIDLGDLPPWYGEVDPIASLPREEREALLEWLVVLQGKTPPLTGARRQAREVIDALCYYDLVRDGLTETIREAQVHGEDVYYDPIRRLRERLGMTPNVDWRGQITSQEVGRAEAARAANAVIRRYDPDFDVERVVEERASQHARRPDRPGSYLAVVRRIFGDAVADDDTIRLLARCGEAARRGKGPREVSSFPLSDEESQEFFRVDHARGTIVQREEFARDFAKKFRQHSECVARRIARELWELRRRGELPSKEIAPLVESMRAFRVPCSRDQEGELRSRLGSWSEPLLFFEEWERAREGERAAYRGGTTSGEDVGHEQLRGRAASELPRSAREERGLARLKEAPFAENARRHFINPILMLVMVYR